MDPISDKLKALGVYTGTDSLKNDHKEIKSKQDRLDWLEVISGHSISNPQGTTIIIEDTYPEEYNHGCVELRKNIPLDGIARWLGQDQISNYPLESFAFIDTETTGLSGGTGTYAFLIGIGRFIKNKFQITQLLMQDPIEEPAQLAALEKILTSCKTIVTFNGKSFDIPLLKTRYKYNRWPHPFTDYPHIDLLHLSRKLWRDRIPSRTLINLELQILEIVRTEEDIPGWMIPHIYFDFITTGDATQLNRIIYHNKMDITSLAALFAHIAEILNNPLSYNPNSGIDLISVGKLFEELGDNKTASRLYKLGLEKLAHNSEDQQTNKYLEATNRLAMIQKRRNNYQIALKHWIHATNYNHIPAFIEIAKYYEHRENNFDLALEWTQSAIRCLEDLKSDETQNTILIHRWRPLLEHRKTRLKRKLGI